MKSTTTTTGTTEMRKSTAENVVTWYRHCGCESDRLARFMRDALRVGGVRDCRALIWKAFEVLA